MSVDGCNKKDMIIVNLTKEMSALKRAEWNKIFT